MIPDLGAYAGAVLSAYAGAFAILGGLVALSLAQARAARRALRDEEARDD